MITQKQVQHIAKLARVGLTDEEILRFQKDLASILAYFEILQEIDVSSITSVPCESPLQNVTRQDVGKAKNPQESQRLLEMAPEAKDGYLKVKSIL